MKISSGWDLLPSVFFGTLHKGWSTPAHTWGSSLKQIRLKMVAKPPSPTENKEQHLTWSLGGLQSSQMPSWQPSGAQKLCDGGRALPWKAAWALPRPPCWRAPQGSCRFPSPGPHGHVMPSAGLPWGGLGALIPVEQHRSSAVPSAEEDPAPPQSTAFRGTVSHTPGPCWPFLSPRHGWRARLSHSQLPKKHSASVCSCVPYTGLELRERLPRWSWATRARIWPKIFTLTSQQLERDAGRVLGVAAKS